MKKDKMLIAQRIKNNRRMLKRYPWLYSVRNTWDLAENDIQEYQIPLRNPAKFLDENIFVKDVRGTEIWLYMVKEKGKTMIIMDFKLASDISLRQLLNEVVYFKAGFSLQTIAKVTDFGNYGPIVVYPLAKPITIKDLK